MLATMQTVYDQRFFFTTEELREKGVDISNCQRYVEEPQMYLLARCSDTIHDRLSYNETRLEDVHQLETPLQDDEGRKYTDILIGMSGDNPEQQAEVGNHYL